MKLLKKYISKRDLKRENKQLRALLFARNKYIPLKEMQRK